jgi:hypothetical protein
LIGVVGVGEDLDVGAPGLRLPYLLGPTTLEEVLSAVSGFVSSLRSHGSGRMLVLDGTSVKAVHGHGRY